LPGNNAVYSGRFQQQYCNCGGELERNFIGIEIDTQFAEKAKILTEKYR